MTPTEMRRLTANIMATKKPKPETFLIEITEEELNSLPIELRRRTSRRFMKAARFQAIYDGDL